MIIFYFIIGLVISLPLILAAGLIGGIVGWIWGKINVWRWRRQRRRHDLLEPS